MSSSVVAVFKEGTPQSEIKAAEDQVVASGGEITHRYTDALLGFAAKVPDAAPGTVNALSTLQTNPQLDYLEPDGTVSIQAQAFLNK
ncbi:hypothetical protein B0O80DRAFT_447954 [Mortierella sp. GBAus27b]|nr:hypothetical protein BGX31_010545 [Mortierella sp. GBA43]KAI8355796.1 hypothetical protein B0O80DRAFT_447954 [Mortierella sp. GBAus27b]